VNAQCVSGACDEGVCAPPLEVDVAIIRSDSTFVDCESSTCFTTIPVSDLNGTPDLQCPGCEGDTYVFEDLVDVWALMYGGLHHDGTVDCDSDVRWTVAGQGHPDAGYETPNSTDPTSYWEYFFETCSDEPCGSHQHLWRPPDTADVTLSFMELTSIDSFCNGTHYEENDPVRRECYGDINDPEKENVCSPDFTLGLVLPVMVPPPYEANHNVCEFGAGHAWGQVSVALQPQCEDGGPSIFGLCLLPKDSDGNLGCINNSGNPSLFTPPWADTRAVNRVLRTFDGKIVRNEEGMEVVNAYFRMHEAHTATPGASLCREADTASQIDCLIQASACSTSFAEPGLAHLYGTMELPLCEGAVIIDIDINICPDITHFSAMPLGIGVGGTINLEADVTDGDGDLLTHLWGATSGTFADASALTTTYTCTEAGEHTITFTVEDPDGCTDEKSVPITCSG
jgi:hypothetical protein